MLILVLAKIFSFVIVQSSCELFADEINEKTFLLQNITIIHECSRSNFLCTQISTQNFFASSFVFEHPVCFNCSLMTPLSRPKQLIKSNLPIFLPDELTCAPSYWNPDPLFIHAGRLYLFIISQYHLEDKLHSDYPMLHKLARMKIIYDLHIPDPYSRRQCSNFINSCSSFYHKLRYWTFSNFQSPLVEVPIRLIPGFIPSNHKMGFYTNIPHKWNNDYFTKFMKLNSKRFTISMWIYLSSHCPYSFCNIISFFDDSNESFASPVVLITSTGTIHFQVRNLISNTDSAFETRFGLPLRSWIHLIFSIDPFKWYLTIFGIDGSMVGKTRINRFSHKIKLNIMEGFGIVGGSQIYEGMHGFVSDCYLHPGIFGGHLQIHKSHKPRHNSLKISHNDRLIECEVLLNELQYYLTLIRIKLSRFPLKLSCERHLFHRIYENEDKCPTKINDLKRPRIYGVLKRLILSNMKVYKIEKILRVADIRKTLLEESNLLVNVIDLLKEHMMTKVMEKLKINGIKIDRVMGNYLKDCSCLGDAEASYILSACYFYGIGAIEINPQKSLETLLINSDIHLHRLSLLALGNIHLLKLIPDIPPVSSVFYKAVADYTPLDIENIENKDMYNDNIRLTNEAELREHTDEDGDLFEWIKHQASSGIPWAKQRLGRILYWGGQGIRRNVNEAINFFRMAAEAPDAEAVDHFDYGLLLIKTLKNDEELEKGKAELKKAAEEEPRALVVLGWLAEIKEKNVSKAYEYYLKAYKLGNPDAAFNIGIYYHYGKHPVIVKNKETAFKYFERAAVHNQLGAGAMYSHYLLSGIKGIIPKDLPVAINWARHVGENNPKIGIYLSEGVRAYRKKQTELSIFYYLLAAFSGIELANFNVALLCDEKEVVTKKYLKKECTWYHYNLSIQREEQMIHPYSLIKMGDKHWYGCLDGQRDINKSIDFYIRAAKKKEPQAFFNLAFILENEDINISYKHIRQIIKWPGNKDGEFQNWRHEAILKLYERCENLSENDNYLPCRLASQRLMAAKLWRDMKMKIQIFVTILMTFVMLYKFVNLWRNGAQQINDNPILSNP